MPTKRDVVVVLATPCSVRVLTLEVYVATSEGSLWAPARADANMSRLVLDVAEPRKCDSWGG